MNPHRLSTQDGISNYTSTEEFSSDGNLFIWCLRVLLMDARVIYDDLAASLLSRSSATVMRMPLPSGRDTQGLAPLPIVKM